MNKITIGDKMKIAFKSCLEVRSGRAGCGLLKKGGIL